MKQEAVKDETKKVEYSWAPSKEIDPDILNPSGICPTEFNVLVKQKEVEEVTKGGIFIPDIAREKEQYAEMEGVMVAASPLAFSYERWPEGARKPAPGDKVIIAKYSGVRVKGNDGVDYILLKDKDVSALRAKPGCLTP